MTVLQEMYNVLEQMVDCAKRDNPKKVSELNKSFEGLFSQTCHNPKTELDAMYDNCRQSCVMAERMRSMRSEYLADALERFSKIPKPLN